MTNTLWPRPLRPVHRLQSLPRDTRDTLFLLLVISWLLLPKLGHLPLWCSGMTACILLWRGAIALRGKTLPSRWWVSALLLLATAATLLSYRTLLGRDAGVTFLVVLLALKTLELRARRDAFVIFFLGFFTLLSNFFYSQSLLTAASMLVGLLGLLTALVLSHMPVGRPPIVQAARTAGWMALLGAPIMAVLFMLFPRIAPLWGLPGDAMAGRSGLSGSMQVGSIAELALDSSVALRIRFDDPVPRQPQLYFRGPVLSTFDGREWRALRPVFGNRAPGPAALQVRGPAVRYQVSMEASQRPWLLVLDAAPTPPEITGYKVGMLPDLQWRTNKPLTDRVRYQAISYPDFRHGPQRMDASLQDYLLLPEGYNPRTLQLAFDLRQQLGKGASAQALIEAVLQRLRTGGYRYTLEPGLYGTHTADEFWFDRKAGFCEHFASSFALLMRALGIPARIVTGYQGGQLNGVDGLWTVRQSDAHAWTEVWLAEQGWVRVDPTAAVSPGRIGSFTRLEAPRSIFQQALGTVVSPRFAINLRDLWEAANERWNQWVLNYSEARQLNLLKNLGIESPSWEHLSYVLIGIVVTVSLAGAAWAQWDRMRQDPWLRLLHGAQAQLRRAGLAVPPTMPPRALAQALLARAPQNSADIARICSWLHALESLRYAPSAPTLAHSRSATGGTPNGRAQRAALAGLQRDYHRLPWPAQLPAPPAPAAPRAATQPIAP